MTFSSDRAAGVLLATACGDALGAGYEFGPPLRDDELVTMKGGNGFRPGQWTDDTSMTVAIAAATAAGLDLRTLEGLTAVAEGFLGWFRSDPPDVGRQTRRVLGAVREGESDPAGALIASARAHFEANPRGAAGNGALMRTAPVALAYLDDPEALVDAAMRVSALTHADPVSGEACALWCLAIRHAVLESTFDGLRLGLRHLPSDRAAYWTGIIDDAETKRPRDFPGNGWVVQALQGAWSAIVTTPVPADDPEVGDLPELHLRRALEAAVRGGADTDTVAAIAGGLLGGRWGRWAVPEEWSSVVFGWPGYRADQLVDLGLDTAMHRYDRLAALGLA